MRRIILSTTPRVGFAMILALSIASAALATDVPDEARKGVKQYKEKQYPDATESFRQAVIAAPDDDRWRYGLGLSQAQSGDFESAQTSFESVAAAEDLHVAADALYNEGNVSLAMQDYAGAIKNYKRSLLKRPGDQDARRNLELALRKLAEQQQQEQQQEEKDGEPSDSTGQQDQKQKQDPQSQDQPDSTQQQQQPDSTGQSQDSLQNAQQQPDSTMTRDQAERILKSLADKEAELRKQAVKIQAAPAPGGKDW